MFDNLFEPLPLGRGGLVLPNRIVMGPITLCQADPTGHVTPWLLEWYRQRAAGGVGAIVGAAAFVALNGRGWPNAVGIADRSHIEGWRQCVKIAHAHGTLVGTQLFHSGAASHCSLLGEQPVCPSEWTRESFDPARAMTEAEAAQAIADFAEGALRSVEAGCDFVELHGAHDYLLHQFWRGDVNRRTDKWGELTAFPVAVTRAVRAAIGPDVPLLYRFSLHADDPAAPNRPVTPDSLEALLGGLEEAGVDVWDISCGRNARRGYFGTDVRLPDWVRRFSDKPRMVAGDHNSPAAASEYLAGGHAEIVAIARALIADAQWAEKARRGASDEIRPWTNACGEALGKGCDPGAA